MHLYPLQYEILCKYLDLPGRHVRRLRLLWKDDGMKTRLSVFKIEGEHNESPPVILDRATIEHNHVQSK
jgi:hypothetical protein